MTNIMRDVVQELVVALQTDRPVAYCRLAETRGSTPQKAGAMMLVFPDGSQAGTLGGGCVEAEVKRRALAVLNEGNAEIAKFQLDHDYGWDDGLICGGRMQVLVEPIRKGQATEYFYELSRLLGANKSFLEREIPHIASLLRESIDEVVQRNEVVVIANGSDAFRNVPQLLDESQILIDFVGIAAYADTADRNGGAARYEGICW